MIRRGNLGIAHVRELGTIQFIDTVDDTSPATRIDSLRVGQEQHGIALAAELDALIDGRQKATTPQAVAGARDGTGDQHDKARQILILGSQPIVDPRSHGRPAEPPKASLKEELGWGVIEVLGMNRLDHADVVSDRRQVR